MSRLLVAVLVSWAILAAAFALTSWVLSGMEVSGGFWGYLWVSALFGVVNAILGTLLRILTLPLNLLTLGLFSVVINAILLSVTDALSSHLTIDDFFWTAIWAAIIMSIVSMVLDFVMGSLVRPRPAPA
jgi:putative membrane protein